MSATKTKRETKKEMTKEEFFESIKGKKHSKTWLAFMDAAKNPYIEIVDMKAVLK